jgi:hypothetical protein
MTTGINATDGPVHQHFGLTYANYLVWPRTLMQSMPEAWQKRFVALAADFDTAFQHVEQAETYQVTAATECEYGDLSDEDMRALGVTRLAEHAGEEEGDDLPDRYYDRDGNEYESWERLLVPRPGGDPVPHYSRGRTYIQPNT